tara:strand:+ start:910 stop:2187 length:1278 start_codon:yes stop_codon:yes gene_type:complete
MKKEIQIDESIIDRFNLLKLNNPERFKDIEVFVNKAVEQYSKDLIKQNKIKSLSSLSVSVGTDKLFKLQKNLSNLTKIKVSKKPFISNKPHRFTTIKNFEKEFLILKSRDFVTIRALQILYNNTLDTPIEFEEFKRLAVKDAIALREEAEVVDYFSMLLKPIGDRQKFKIKRSVGLPKNNKGSIGKYIRSYVGYQPDKKLNQFKGPLFELGLVNLYKKDKEILIGLSESGYSLLLNLSKSNFCLDYPHSINATFIYSEYLKKVKNTQYVVFAQVLTLLFELFGREKKMLKDDFWIELYSLLESDENSIGKLLSENNRNITFSNILSNLEEWGLVKPGKAQTGYGDDGVVYSDWFFDAATSQMVEDRDSIENKITEIYIHPKVNGSTIDYSGRDYALKKSKKTIKEYDNFYTSFEEYLKLAKKYRA